MIKQLVFEAVLFLFKFAGIHEKLADRNLIGVPGVLYLPLFQVSRNEIIPHYDVICSVSKARN